MPIAAKSSISPIVTIEQIFKACHFNSFIVFDLDNTVFEPLEEVGSDQCFDALLKLASQGAFKGDGDGRSLVINFYCEIQRLIHVKAVEERIKKIIKCFQDLNIPVIALTSRGYNLSLWTEHQLKEIKIDFSRGWKTQSFWFNMESNHAEDPSYANGIIYCCGKNKGKCLEEFLIAEHHWPNEIIMIDDKENNLETVMEQLKNYQIKFIGLRYAFLDEKVLNFNLEKAITEFESLNIQLSAEAEKLITILKKNIFSPIQYSHNNQTFFSGKNSNCASSVAQADVKDYQNSVLIK